MRAHVLTLLIWGLRYLSVECYIRCLVPHPLMHILYCRLPFFDYFFLLWLELVRVASWWAKYEVTVCSKEVALSWQFCDLLSFGSPIYSNRKKSFKWLNSCHNHKLVLHHQTFTLTDPIKELIKGYMFPKTSYFSILRLSQAPNLHRYNKILHHITLIQFYVRHHTLRKNDISLHPSQICTDLEWGRSQEKSHLGHSTF